MNLDTAKSNMNQSIEFLNAELRKIRAGRANPDMVKDIKVTAYGSPMTVEQLSNINIVDATLITLQVWDKTVIPDVVKAIQSSDLGINPSVDGTLIRLPLPPMTTERRQEYVKLMKQKVEEAKISIRQKRKDYMMELERKTKEENLPKEEFEREEKQLQVVVDEMNKKIDEIGAAKESELMSV